MIISRLLSVYAVAGMLLMNFGCATTLKPMPSDITLRDALIQVRDGIQVLQERPKSSKPAGLLISEVQVTFNITANSKDTTKLGLDLAPGAVLKEVPTGSYERYSESGLNRSNQITFKFQNVFFAGKDTLMGVAITPITTTSEKTVTKTKDKDTDTSTNKIPRVEQLITLEQLFKMLDERVIMKSQ